VRARFEIDACSDRTTTNEEKKEVAMKKIVGRLAVVVMAAGVVVSMVSGAALAKSPKNQVFVIGDSLSDPGNLFTLTGFFPPSPPYAHRNCNGPVWTEYFSTDMAVPVDSRAYGGALSGIFDFGGENVSNFNTVQYYPYFPGLPGVSEEIDGLIAASPGRLNKDALYVIWAGANDFFLGLTLMEQSGNPDALTATLEQTLANIADSIHRLSAAGARHFAIGNMPDIGLTPFAKDLAPGDPELFSYVIGMFNEQLAQVLANLPEGWAETMVILDTYEIMQAVYDKPELFNLTNVTEACLTAGGICSEPEKYLFWDSVHPTTAGQAIFADEFRAAFCGTGADHPGLRGRPTGAPPEVWRGVCYGTK
jgi:phospholipase/lecithinase/hemolysin